MKLVTWPTAKENRQDTWTVISSSIMFASYLGLLDYLFNLINGHL